MGREKDDGTLTETEKSKTKEDQTEEKGRT
jgi:hypothetical protein